MKTELIEWFSALNNVENKGMALSIKSYSRGVHECKKTQLEEDLAEEAFFKALKELRDLILKEF